VTLVDSNLTTGWDTLLLGVLNAACPQGTICADNLNGQAYALVRGTDYAAYKETGHLAARKETSFILVEGSTSGLSYAQLGQLAAQIAPGDQVQRSPAVVAENYSTWISTSQLNSYIGEMNTAMAALGTSCDMIWDDRQRHQRHAGGSETGRLTHLHWQAHPGR